MTTEHFVRCDVELANGHRCERRAPVDCLQRLPPGWSSVTAYRKATVEDLPSGKMLASMSPVIDHMADEARAGKLKEAADLMHASMLETYGAVSSTAHVCPDHPIPKFHTALEIGPSVPLELLGD